jgi:formate C-acetyltransferase
MTEACIERGLNLDDGGAIYNYGCIETGGHGTVGDSLYAMKKLVYDEKKISLETLDAALKANFVGYDEVRQMLLAVPKYGNGDEEADAMSAKVLEHYWTEIGKYTSRHGGVFTGACSLLEGGISMGRNVGAMPDGRFAGEPLGNTIGPRTGSDKSGVTNMLLSVSRMPLKLGVGGSGCRRIRRCPGAQESAFGKAA